MEALENNAVIDDPVRLAQVMEAGRFTIWERDLATDSMSWSGEHQTIFGMEPGMFSESYEAFLNSVHPEDRSRVRTAEERALQNGTQFDEEFRILWPDGRIHWIAGRSVPLRLPSNESQRQVGVYYDITDRKNAELGLERENRRNAAILESIADAFVAFDCNLNCTYANRMAELLLAWKPRSWNHRQADELFSNTLGIELQWNAREALAEQIPVTFETQYADLELEVRLIPSPDGLSAYLRDITEQKRLQLERQTEAERQRVFMRQVLASVTEGRLQLCDTPQDLPVMLPGVREKRTVNRSDGLGQLRHDARETAEAIGFDPKVAIDLEIATGEAGMNAVVHAECGHAWVCTDGSSTIQIWVQDRGAGIAFDKLPQATLQRGYSSSGTMGHGFKIILQTAHKVWLLTGPSGTTVVLEQHNQGEPEFPL